MEQKRKMKGNYRNKQLGLEQDNYLIIGVDVVINIRKQKIPILIFKLVYTWFSSDTCNKDM